MRSSYKYSPFCYAHGRFVKWYGHPAMRALKASDIARYEKRITASLRLLSPGLRSKIADNAVAAVTILREHVQTVESKTVARRPEAKLRPTEALKYQHSAAKALLPVLTNVEPKAIVLRATAIMLLYVDEPHLLQNSDTVYKAALFHSVRKLYRLADRYHWDQRRAHTKHGGSRGYYRLPTIRARELGASWLMDAIVPPAMVLLRTVRASEVARKAELRLAQDLGAASEAEIAERLRVMRARQTAYQRYRFKKEEKEKGLSPEEVS